MNKKLIALAMVLLLAVGGLFADVYSGTLPGAVTATLNATIGDYLHHGFIDASNPGVYSASKTIEDAFTTNPAFQYGYTTNIDTSKYGFKFQMVVGDFINQDDTDYAIKIASVSVGNTVVGPDTAGTNLYTILNSATSGSTGQVSVVVSPAKSGNDGTETPETTIVDHLGSPITQADFVGGADVIAGSYQSTVTISVLAV